MTYEELPQDVKDDLDVILSLKIKEFRSSEFKTITKQDIINYLCNVKWKRRDRIMTYDVVNDIFEANASAIFDYLKTEGIKSAKHLKIDDFADLLG